MLLNKHTRRGMVSVMYGTQKQKSKRRGHPPPAYLKYELWEWLNKQVNFDVLYLGWINSGYNSYLKPSVDRLDDSKPYTLDNIQLLTWYENKYKGRIRHEHSDKPKKVYRKKVIAIYDSSEELFDSLNDASRALGVHVSHISGCCRGKRKSAGGYCFKFA